MHLTLNNAWQVTQGQWLPQPAVKPQPLAASHPTPHSHLCPIQLSGACLRFFFYSSLTWARGGVSRCGCCGLGCILCTLYPLAHCFPRRKIPTRPRLNVSWGPSHEAVCGGAFCLFTLTRCVCAVVLMLLLVIGVVFAHVNTWPHFRDVGAGAIALCRTLGYVVLVRTWGSSSLICWCSLCAMLTCHFPRMC